MKYLLLLILLIPLVSSEVIINEINARPYDDESLNEWIEIYSSEEINLTGWSIGDESGNDSIVGGCFDEQCNILIKNQYAIITDDMTRAYNNYNFSKNVLKLYVDDSAIGNSLKYTGEFVALYNDKDELVDFVKYPQFKEKGLTYARINGTKWWFANPTMGYGNDESYVDYFEGECDWKVDVEVNNSEVRTVVSNVRPLTSYVTLKRRIVDYFGEVVKEYNDLTFEATKKKTITNSPSLSEGVFMVEVLVNSSCLDFNLDNNQARDFFMVSREKKNRSTIEIEKIYNSDNLKVREEAKFKLKIYKGDSKSNVITYYVKEGEEKVSKESRIVVRENFKDYEFTLTFVVPDICGSGLTLFIEGFNEEDEKDFDVESCVNDVVITNDVFDEVVIVEEEVIFVNYVSNNKKVSEFSTYFFILTLILLIIYLFFVKRKVL
jgi:hypothetical protein